MDSSSFHLLPPPPPSNPNPSFSPAYHHHTTTVATNLPPDINTTLSTLKHLIHLSKTTIHSLSNILPTTTTTTTTVTCPYNSNHRLPPSSLFRHHLHCPSSPAPIDLSLLHYPKTLNSHLINHNNNNNNSSTITDLSISLHDYHTSLDPNFFYLDCPSVVTFPQNNNKPDCMLNLPAVLSAECADFTIEDDLNDVVNGLFTSNDFVKLLPSQCYNVRTEINQWSNDFPSFYSRGVLCTIVCCYLYPKEDLMEWILVHSSFYGVVIDVFMRDHLLLLFRLCLKALVREASGYLVSISKGDFAGGMDRFDCPVLVRVLMWLGSQFGILYGEVNGKLFAINMLKQCLLSVLSKSIILYDATSGLSDFNGNKEIDGSRKEMILVSKVAAAVAALHERFAVETRIKAIRSSRFVPVYHRVQEHEYISKTADEERKKRPNYRPIIDHDGVLWHRGGNQDSNKNKSREELLAEERDYKRRRMSYRGKKMKRNTTQVMRDIIDEYMEEIKHANLPSQPFVDATNPESEPSSISNVHADKHSHNEIIQKESASDINMRSARYEDEVKEKRSTRYDDEVKERRSARYEDEVKPKRSGRYDDEVKEKSSRRYDDEVKEKRSARYEDEVKPERSARYADEVKEKSNRHRHKDNRSNIRTKDRSSSPNNRHKSKHKDKRSSSFLHNEFEDRYDPSESQ